MKRQWLITSFEPFAGRTENHSQAVMREIENLVLELSHTPDWQFNFFYLDLPVEYDRCFTVLKDAVAAHSKNGIQLEGILSIGEGAEEFKIETQANNLDDVSNFPDNSGVVRERKKIIAGLPDDMTIPLRFPVEAFQRIRTSNNPGFFVCNHLCARMAYEFGGDPKKPLFGFIHVPRTGQGGVFTADVCAAMIVNGFKKL
jgi:pyrrolidone-carboxylate peptidase